MVNNLIVHLILRFGPVFTRWGVDEKQLAIILKTKLLMDDRRPLTSFGNRQGKENKYSSWISLLLLAIMGGVLLFFLVLVNKPFVSYTIYFGAFMAMLCLTLIADFSVILLDGRDNFIILPRPVSDRTLSVARIMHIGISVSKQVVWLALPGFVYTAIAKGFIGALLFIVQACIATALCVLLVNLFYLVAMRFLSAQRFKDLVAYLQIVFSVLIFALYYTTPSILGSALVQQLNFYTSYWLWLMPSAWIAALQEVGAGDFSGFALTLTALAFLAPIIAFGLITNKFSKGFNRVLAGMGIESHSIREKEGLIKRQFSWCDRWSAILTKSPLESAGFKFVWRLTGRTREFKTKVYPSMAYVPVYFFFLFFIRNNGHEEMGFQERWQMALRQHTYLFIFYFSLFTLLTVFQFITQSEKYKAAWVYFVAPIRKPGLLMSGVLKAAFVKFYMPFVLIFTLLGMLFIGSSVLNDILLSAATGGIVAILICLFTVNGYPFSQPIKKSEGRFIANLLLIGLVGSIGFGHYLAVKYEWLVWLLAVLFTLVFWIMLRFFKKEKWEKVIFRD
ncbi:hypothetical protein GCM10023231_37350 [Olivibacter ginsenosidimutans]|uniref:ABC transporter permease n=1 Tax=Olivibacter ginsenosidimutans TaxID=1176537 RepID=A0ABP9C7L2_9SPHI